MGAPSRIVAAVMNKHAALVSIGRYLGMFDAKVKVEAVYGISEGEGGVMCASLIAGRGGHNLGRSRRWWSFAS